MRRGWLKPKEIRFQQVSELSKADVNVSQFRWQIVPDSGSSNRKVSVAETVLCSWDNACSVVGWSKETPSAVSEKLDIVGKVLGAWPRSDLYMIQASLNHTRWRTGRSCRSCSNAQVIMGQNFRSQDEKLSDCCDGRPWLKSRLEFETINKLQPATWLFVKFYVLKRSVWHRVRALWCSVLLMKLILKF